jgi:hypothetical protein
MEFTVEKSVILSPKITIFSVPKSVYFDLLKRLSFYLFINRKSRHFGCKKAAFFSDFFSFPASFIYPRRGRRIFCWGQLSHDPHVM